MLTDKELIYERYLFSKRKQYNMIHENKCCETCGKFLTEQEFKYIYGSEDDDDILLEAKGKINGYVIYEGTNAGGNYACIATGLFNKSKNVKTGPMVQIFIVNADMHPVEALRTGKNMVQCLDCIHRPATEEEKEKGIKGGSCYVDVGKSVAQVYKAYKRGCYPNICGDNKPQIGDTLEYIKCSENKISEIFGGRKVRFGAYGEPVLIPFRIVDNIAKVSSGHTGYTHQWKQPLFELYKKYFMASVDSPAEYKMAKSKGWRTFRVSTDWDLHEKEMICMNSWQDKTCYECLLCGGNETNIKQDITIKVHGKLKSNFKSSSEALASFGESGDVTDKYDEKDDVNPELTRRIMNLSSSQKLQIKKAEDIEQQEKQEKEKRKEERKKKKEEEKLKNEITIP